MSEERFEVFGNIIKDNEDIPALLNNYQATVRLNELNDKVKELEKELAEIKKNAIVPRFEYGDKVYYIKYFVGKWQVFNQEYVGENISNIIVRTMNYYSELPKDSVFATEQEAQAKLQELRGGE